MPIKIKSILLRQLAVIAFAFLVIPKMILGEEFIPKSGTMWELFEWEINNPTWSGNPFDLLSTVTFVNESNKETRKSRMFYAGNSIWKFRFTGIHIGKWSFLTSSEDSDLNNHRGSIIIKKNTNPNIQGFLTHDGNNFAIQTGNEPLLRVYRFIIYMNEKKFRTFDSNLKNKHYLDSPLFNLNSGKHLGAYLKDAEDNGFEVIFLHPGYPHVWTDGTDVYNGKNPRLETFELLEKVITTAHSKGMRVHIWMWGDDQRQATPKTLETSIKSKVYQIFKRYVPEKMNRFLDGGINGKVDRRLQRYIAARLGPLPGWSMGYGFDLHEWTTPTKLNEWASFLHDQFGGWDHLLSARGFSLDGLNNINSYDGFGRQVPLTTSKYGPKDYEEVAKLFSTDNTKPHLFEERHSYRRKNFDLGMAGTRRLIWWMLFSGGVGGWFGFYSNSEYPYPKPEQLRTTRHFFKKHLFLNMKPANYLTNGYALKSPDHKQYIFYRESSPSIKVNLTSMIGAQPVVAIDTKKEYLEISLNTLYPQEHNIILPYESDWAIAVGAHRSKGDIR